MAAFSSQISLIDPTLPNQETLKEILEILQMDSNSILLEAKIIELGFSRNVVDKLRSDPQFLLHTVETLQKKLAELREEHFKIVAEAYSGWVEKGIVNEDLSLFEKMLISQQPEIVKRLEAKWKLAQTGNFDSTIDNYRHKKYTRQCFHYGHTPNFCMREAARWRHLDIVKEALKRGANDYNSAMNFAAEGGHKEIVHMMLDRGADDYNEAMIYAAEGGHKEIVEMMLNLGANDYDEAMNFAAQGGHKEIVQMMLELGVNNYNEAMIYAAANGRKDIVQMMLELGANNYNEAMIYAAAGGHKEIVQMMLDLGANNYDDFMY